MCAMISSLSCHGGKDLHSEYLPCPSDIAGVGKYLSSTREKRSSLRTPITLIPPQLPIVTICYDLASRWWHCVPCNSIVKGLCKRQLWYVFLCHHYGIPPHTRTHDKKRLYTISTNYLLRLHHLVVGPGFQIIADLPNLSADEHRWLLASTLLNFHRKIILHVWCQYMKRWKAGILS